MANALTELLKLQKQNPTCGCCGATFNSREWYGCDCGDPNGELHPDNCDNDNCKGGKGCGYWQMLLSSNIDALINVAGANNLLRITSQQIINRVCNKLDNEQYLAFKPISDFAQACEHLENCDELK